MPTVTLSLWLPVSRPYFFNRSEDDWLRQAGTNDVAQCSSTRIDDQEYVPLVLVSVLRRLLEVLPRSFGYDRVGECRLRGDSAGRRRPVDVTLRLDLTRLPARSEVADFWHAANDELVTNGATEVRLFVDENGWYAFTATHRLGADPDKVRTALVTHIRQVFGGDYVVHPLPTNSRKVDVGSSSLKEYSGLKDEGGIEVRKSQPRGAMSFAQLNIIAEGLWNDTLSPAVYLEQHDFMTSYLDSKEAEDFLRSIADVIEALTTESDATQTLGQIAVLHHFLTITSGGSLLKLQSALDSSRRRLLTEMLASLHRQTRLVQLQFTNNIRERRPELAVTATESQLKGYATLVSAKFPLFTATFEMIRLAYDHLAWLVERDGPIVPPDQDLVKAKHELDRLKGQVAHWRALIGELGKNVDSLGRTIERATQDALLYEQQQARSDQEAMAEIERSRLSRPINNTASRAAYGLITVVLGLIGVVFTAGSDDVSQIGQPGVSAWRIAVLLWPVWAALALSGLVLPVVVYLWRVLRHDRRGNQGSHPYQFSFQLDNDVDPDRLRQHVADRERRQLPRSKAVRQVLHKVGAENRGYGRVERSSEDTTTVKAHTLVTLRMRWLTYARFEVINEILMHKIALQTKRVLVQCRVFGESPQPLTAEQVRRLLTLILDDVKTQFAPADAAGWEESMEQLVDETLYGTPDKQPAGRTSPGDLVPHPRDGVLAGAADGS